jgi:hypothetical protein
MNELLEAQERGDRVIVLRQAVELPAQSDEQLHALVTSLGDKQNIQQKRHQVALPMDLRMPRMVRNVMAELDAIVRYGFLGRTPSTYVALWSDAGCQVQRPHSDFKFPDPAQPLPLPDDIHDRGWSMLFSTHDGGILPIWQDDDHLEDFELIPLNRGDLCFSRYDVVHAGAPYPAGHKYRIHTRMRIRLPFLIFQGLWIIAS